MAILNTTTSSAIEDVFARQLFPLKKGYPLWYPEAREDGEVLLGDVGYIHRGAFIRLFNALHDADDPVNQRPDGVPNVPEGFEKLFVAQSPHRIVNAIAGALSSKTMRDVRVEANGQAHGVSAGLCYECTDHQGAVLVLGSPAERQEILMTKVMTDYMKANIQAWAAFTNTLGLGLDSDDIIFVKGWVKTTHWAMAAFREAGKSGRCHVTGDFGSVASATLSASLIRATNQVGEARCGPDEDTAPEGPPTQRKPDKPAGRGVKRGRGGDAKQSAVTAPQRPKNQCVFLHYFKYKRRRLLAPAVIQAAAGERSSFHSHEDGDIEEVPPPESSYEPVQCILDYILENSNATHAIASDGDLFSLDGDEVMDFSSAFEDLPTFLSRTRPMVRVGADGSGTLRVRAGKALLPGAPLTPTPTSRTQDVPPLESSNPGVPQGARNQESIPLQNMHTTKRSGSVITSSTSHRPQESPTGTSVTGKNLPTSYPRTPAPVIPRDYALQGTSPVAPTASWDPLSGDYFFDVFRQVGSNALAGAGHAHTPSPVPSSGGPSAGTATESDEYSEEQSVRSAAAEEREPPAVSFHPVPPVELTTESHFERRQPGCNCCIIA